MALLNYKKHTVRARNMALLTQKGYRLCEVAKEYKLPYSVVANSLISIQKSGVKVVWSNIGIERTKKAKKVAALFESGFSCNKISEKLKISIKTVRCLLVIAKKLGLKVKLVDNDANNKKFAERRKEIAELTQQGLSVKEIAAKYGISRQAVSSILRKAAKEGNIVVLSKRVNCDNLPNIIVKKKEQKTVACIVCGNTFFSKKGKTKTCGTECRNKYCSKIKTSKEGAGLWSRHTFVTLTCNKCGKEFQRSNYINSVISVKAKEDSKKYCSRKCYEERKLKKELI